MVMATLTLMVVGPLAKARVAGTPSSSQTTEGSEPIVFTVGVVLDC